MDLDLLTTLRSTGAARQFHPEPVADDVLARLLDTARFAPSGGNRQGWRVIVVKDPAARAALRDLYLSGWYEYLAMGSAGLVPWAPVTDREAEAGRHRRRRPQFAEAGAAAPGFAETLDTAPALLLVLADLTALAAVDRDLPRYTLVGGASIYPFVWSLLLAARTEGLGGVMTTMAVRQEDEVRALFGIPDTVAVAALVVLGRPVTAHAACGARRCSSFAWVDRYEGAPLPTLTRSPLRADRRGRAPVVPPVGAPTRAVLKWAMAQNVLGEALEPCNFDPVTGFYRDGCCNTGAEDVGVHTVCTRVTAEFLAFSASVGNDLSTPHPEFGFAGLQPGRPVVPVRAALAGGLRGRHGAARRPGRDPRRHARVGAAGRPGGPRHLSLAARRRPRTRRSCDGAERSSTPSSASSGSSRRRPPHIFAVVADATRHPEIDGSGQLVKAKRARPQHLSLGSTFGMSMKMGVPYTMTNTVIEFEQDRRIAWQTVLAGPLGRFLGGRIWRYELEAVDGGTMVTEILGHQPGQAGASCSKRTRSRPAHRGVHDQDARPAGRDHRVVSGAIMIDAAWEQRILPALSEYTRIPCLSPAFDPDWAERGAIAAAAELLRDLGAATRSRRCSAEIVELPGRTPAAADRQRRHGRPDRRLRPHGQAAAARRVAQRARALRAGARGRPPLRPGHGRRRLRDVRRRDGSGGGGRRPGPRPRPHRGERGERQPRPRSRTWRTSASASGRRAS